MFMSDSFQEFSYQHFMLSEFEGRKSRNPSYSLRAFARDLGLAAPKLSEILRNKCGISENSAKRLVQKLNLSEHEAEAFVNLVISKHSRLPSQRASSIEKLKTLRDRLKFNEVSLESFKVISDWYHYAILELTEVRDFKSTVGWVASRLQISNQVVEEGIRRLFDCGLIEKNKDGKWHQTTSFVATPSGIPSVAIRNHHRQILSKADEALVQVPVRDRDFSAVTMAISKDQIEYAQKLIKEFRRELTTKLAKAKEKDRVYCLSVQFFPLDRVEESR